MSASISLSHTTSVEITRKTSAVVMPLRPRFRNTADRQQTCRRGVFAKPLSFTYAGRRVASIGWECVGKEGAPIVVVLGGISADRHVLSSRAFSQPGWWEAQHGKGLNLDACRVLSMNWLGAAGEVDAPIDTRDQAHALAALLDHLGIARVEAVVGASYGAMVGMQFAANYGKRLKRLVALSAAHRSHPYASAWRSIQRKIIGLAASDAQKNACLALARQLAMLSYRTADEFAQRFDQGAEVNGSQVRVAAEDYLDYCGNKFIGRMSPMVYRRLSESIDLHQVAPETIHVPVDLLAVEEDLIVPPADMQALHAGLADSRYDAIHSEYGHDAFLKETQAVARFLQTALQASSPV